MSRPADEELIGRNIAGKFLIERFLGGGAMGAVYKAYQKSIEKHVAIKVLHREFVATPSFVARFEREAKSASLLDHINLMRVIDYGREPDGVCYIAMELLEGRSLYQVLRDDGRLQDERIAGLVRQTLAGLAVAHELGLIHRDLKPENIIVLEKFDDDGKRVELVKVCDFGMAKLVTPDPETDASSTGPSAGEKASEKLTSHGVVVGTPDYMSPEQGKGERLDARSDLYAVGVILYQMLAGTLPFSADTPIATLLRQVIDAPKPPSEINPSVHPGLEAICLRALAKRREDRFQTAREMRAEIRAVLEGRGALVPSALPAPRLALGSIPDTGLAAFDFRPAPLPRSLNPSGSPLALGLAPPSHRIRALEALQEEPSPERKWMKPLVVSLLVVTASLAVVAAKRRHTVARASDSLDHAGRLTGGAPASVTADVTRTLSVAPALPPTGLPPGEEPPGRTGGTDSRSSGAAAYAAPVSASLSVRGVGKAGSTAAAGSAASSAAGPPPSSGPLPSAFGVLAVPEVPAIEGKGGLTSSSTASPPGAPPATPSAEPFAHATVALVRVRAEGVAEADVLGVMPRARFDQCYRKSLASRPGATAGAGSLHLAIDALGHVGSASFAGTEDLAAVGQCIADAAIGADIRHVAAGATFADIDLAFRSQ